MKSQIAYQPHLTVRIVSSLALQILIAFLLRRPHQDSIAYNICILAISHFAMVPFCSGLCCLNRRTVVMFGLLSIFPQFVSLVTLLRLLGFKVLVTWLLGRLQFWF
jgi:hypothetical protein